MVYGYNDKQYNNDLFSAIIEGLKKQKSLAPEKVIYNDPATIIFWNDGTKTVVKAHDGDQYDPVVGFLLAVMKRFYGNKSAYNDILRKVGCFEKRAEMMEKEPDHQTDVFEAFKNSVKNATEAIKSVNQKISEQMKTNIRDKSTIEVMPIKEAVEKGYIPNVFVKPANTEILPDKVTRGVLPVQEKVEELKEQRTKLESDIDKLDPWEERMAQIGANDILKNKAEKVESSKPLSQMPHSGYRHHANPRFIGLEKWLKENDMAYVDLDAVLGKSKSTNFTAKLMTERNRDVPKTSIDKVLAATGLTFEQAFLSK